MKGVSLGLDCFTILVSVVLLFALLSESRTKKLETTSFMGVVITNGFCAILDLFVCILRDTYQYTYMARNLYNLSYVIYMVTMLYFCFFQYHMMRKKVYIADGIDLTMIFMCLSPSFIWLIGNAQTRPWFIHIENDGTFVRGDAFWVALLIPSVIMLFNLVFILTCKDKLSGRELFAWISYEIFPAIIYIVFFTTGLFYESILYMAVALSSILIYAEVHLSELREGVEVENQLNKSRMQLMVSQIQPHFLYNALNSIYALIDVDKEQAQEAVSTFADYLRQNINALKTGEPVKFEEELEHTKAYLYLEQIRFGNKLNILYDIKATDFIIPPLTVQPLAENAIKHGISKKSEGGTLKISSSEDENNYYVQIVDDGLGFDAKNFAKDDKHTHVGLNNVNSRIVNMVHGKLSVKSVPDEGTICEITIPKK